MDSHTIPAVRNAFTLIELLIVVAIIAILAAIAVPNFLEAQTRAKVSRAEADMRSLAVAIEAYRVDWNAYPPTIEINDVVTFNATPGFAAVPRINRLVILTTPVAHITSVPRDPFGDDREPEDGSDTESATVPTYLGGDVFLAPGGIDRRASFSVAFREYPAVADGQGQLRTPLWVLFSQGPDADLDNYDDLDQTTEIVGAQLAVYQAYDPTNGTVSDGDITRFRE